MRVARFLQDCAGIGGQSEGVLGDSSDGGGGHSLALFGSTEHEGLVNSAKSIRYYKSFQNRDERDAYCRRR
jgi:hypothetical protein